MDSRIEILCVLCLLLACNISGFHFITPKLLRRNTIAMSDDTETSSPSAPPPAVVVKSHQIFIGNIPLELDEGAVSDIIKQKAGDFKAVRLAKDLKTGAFRGFAYVDFEEKSQAEAAISALTGADVDGKILKIDFALPRAERPKPVVPPQENSCFIGNLDFAVSDSEIMDLCNEKLGEGVTLRVRLATDRETGKKRGFGHIDFASPEDAKQAIQALNGIAINGRELRIDHARRREDVSSNSFGARGTFARKQFSTNNNNNKDCSVFVGNLSWEVSEGLLREMLDDVVGRNTYTNVRLAIDRDTQRPKGYAHIDFVDPQTARNAVTLLNDVTVMDRDLRADMAQRKDARSSAGGPSSA